MLIEKSVGANLLGDWEEHVGGRPFISSLTFQRARACETGERLPVLVGKHAVFLPLPEEPNRHQIVEVSANLHYLKTKYSVDDDAVLVLTEHSS